VPLPLKPRGRSGTVETRPREPGQGCGRDRGRELTQPASDDDQERLGGPWHRPGEGLADRDATARRHRPLSVRRRPRDRPRRPEVGCRDRGQEDVVAPVRRPVRRGGGSAGAGNEERGHVAAGVRAAGDGLLDPGRPRPWISVQVRQAGRSATLGGGPGGSGQEEPGPGRRAGPVGHRWHPWGGHGQQRGHALPGAREHRGGLEPGRTRAGHVRPAGRAGAGATQSHQDAGHGRRPQPDPERGGKTPPAPRAGQHGPCRARPQRCQPQHRTRPPQHGDDATPPNPEPCRPRPLPATAAGNISAGVHPGSSRTDRLSAPRS
jgi:hypothetical protein